MRALAISACFVWSAALASAQTVSSLTFTPSVIPAGSSDPLLVEAEVSGAVTSVTVDFNPVGTTSFPIALRDDGTGGDRAAGDRVYSGRLPVAPIVAARTADDVFRVFIGYLNLDNGATRVSRFNLFIDVYTSDIGVYPVRRLSQFVQATSRLVNIHDATYFATANNGVARITQEFYRWFRDDYDIVNIVFDPLRFLNRNHDPLTNRVRGIGLGIADRSSQFGSGGRLQGVSQFPVPYYYDGADTGFIHELGHQWINYLPLSPLAAAVPHWPYSSMAGGVMGFSIGGTGGEGGTFACTVYEDSRGVVLDPRPDAPGYNDLDLYLMGLMPANEVHTQIVFTDQAAAARLNCNGSVFTGAVTRVNVNDVINSVGARSPAYGEAPRSFRVATILVTRNGLASQEMMSLYSWMTERAEWRARVPTHTGFVKESGQPFYVATRGRGTLDTSLDLGAPDFVVLPAQGSVAIGGTASATLTIFVGSRFGAYASPVSLSCGTLPAGASCAFSTPSVMPGTAGQDAQLTVATTGTARGTYTILVNGQSNGATHSTAVMLTVQ